MVENRFLYSGNEWKLSEYAFWKGLFLPGIRSAKLCQTQIDLIERVWTLLPLVWIVRLGF
jgi:hypothetical protein